MKVFMLLSIFILSSVSILEADNKGIEESSSDYDYRGKLSNLKERILVINDAVGSYASWDVYTHLMDARDRFLQFDENLSGIDNIGDALGAISVELDGVANDYLAISNMSDGIAEQMVIHANNIETIDVENDEVIVLLEVEIAAYQDEINSLENFLIFNPDDMITIVDLAAAKTKQSLLEDKRTMFLKLAIYLENLVPNIQSFSQSIIALFRAMDHSADIYADVADVAAMGNNINGFGEDFSNTAADVDVATLSVVDDWNSVRDISKDIADSVVIVGP